MKKRKLPIVLFTALVVLVGGAFMFNVISQRSAGNEAYASEPGKDPSIATGNDTTTLSTKDMKASVAQSMKAATAVKAAPKMSKVRSLDEDASSGPMILNSETPIQNRKPSRLPSDAHGVGQWYTDSSKINSEH